MRYSCLVLDHDDTAVDSTATVHYPAHVEVMRRMRPGEKPVSLEEWFCKNFDPGILEFLVQELHFTRQELDEEYRIWKRYAETRIPDFYPGFIDAIAAYRKKRGKIVVVSHSIEEIISRDYRALTPGHGGELRQLLRPSPKGAVRVPDFEKRNQAEKGTEWMPWCQQAMKDVISCDKLR